MKQPSDDREITKLHEMNVMIKGILDQTKNDPIMDLYPSLFKLREILFPQTARLLERIDDELKEIILPKIAEAKV